jgi:hypothetical protein
MGDHKFLKILGALRVKYSGGTQFSAPLSRMQARVTVLRNDPSRQEEVNFSGACKHRTAVNNKE